MTIKFQIKELTQETLEGAAKLHYESWLETYTGLIGEDYLDNLSFERKLRIRKRVYNDGNPIGKTYVAITGDEQIIGFCSANQCTDNNLANGEIYAIYVLKKFQGQGVGSKLFDQASEYLSENKLKPFIIWVLGTNTKACRFYENKGGVLTHKKMDTIGINEYEILGYLF